MKKELKMLSNQLNNRMYLTTNPLNFNGYEDCKYFICWQNTHKVYKACRTQDDCIDILKNIITEGVAYDGNIGFNVA